jgi:hypothetical protein
LRRSMCTAWSNACAGQYRRPRPRDR